MRRLATALFLLSLFSTYGMAQSDVVWVGTAGGGDGTTWTDGNNWDVAVPPTANDTAIIPGTESPTITAGLDGSANPYRLTIRGSLTFNETNGTLTTTDSITGPGTLTLSANMTLTTRHMSVNTLSVGSVSPVIDVRGNWTVPNFTAGQSDVRFNTPSFSTVSQITQNTTFNILRVQKAGTDTVRSTSAVTVTVGNFFVLSSGIFEHDPGSGITLVGAGGVPDYDSITVSASAQLRILGTGAFPAEFEAISLATNSIIAYAGASQNVTGVEDDGQAFAYSTLTLTGTGTKTAVSDLDVNGNFTFNTAGVTFDLASFTHRFSSATWSATAGSISGGTSTVNFDGGTQSITSSAGNLNNVTFSGSFITLAAAFTAGGNVSITGILNTGGFDLSVGGNWTRSGTFNHDNGRVIFFGAAQNIDPTTFFILWLNGSGTKSALGGLTINDTVRVYSGVTLGLNAHTHTLSGNVELLNGTSSVTSTGTIQFNNTANIFIDVQPDGAGASFNNMTLLNTGRVDIDNDSVVFAGNVTIGNTSILRLENNGSFSCNNLIVNGTLDLFGTRSFPGIGGTVTYNQPTPLSFTEGRLRYGDDADQLVSPLASGCYTLELTSAANLYTVKTATSNLVINYRLLVGTDGGGAAQPTTFNTAGFDLAVTNNVIINNSDTLVVGGVFTHQALSSEFAELTMTDAGSTARLTRYIVTQLATPADGRELTLRVTGAGASLQISDAWQITNPFGSSSTLFEIEFANSTNVQMTGSADSLVLGANCWISTSGGVGSATNFRDFIYTVENVDFNSQSGVSYYSGTQDQTIAAFYNGGVTPLSYANLHIDNGSPGNFKVAEGPLDVNGFFVGNGDARFVDGGFSHTVSGNVAIQNQTGGDRTGTLTFDGANQSYSNHDFFNVVFAGTGTKSNAAFTVQVPAGGNDQTFNVAAGAINVDNDVTIASGVTVDGGTFAWTVADDWTNNGGTFQHTGTVTFDGTADQVINGQFNNITFANTADTIWAGNTITANTVTFNANSTFADSGKTINVSGNWTRASGVVSRFVPTGTVNFNGTSTTQTINIAGTDATANANDFFNVIFSGAATKQFTVTANRGIDANGNFTIRAGSGTVTFAATFDSCAGNFADSAGTMSFTTGTFVFDGAGQNIGAAQNFFNLVCGGTGTKTLTGNIRALNNLTINTGSTLDVSASNFSVEVRSFWVNSGTFVPRQGTVTFSGTGNSGLSTGGTGAGKRFYNVIVNKSGSAIASLSADGAFDGDLTITNASATAGFSTGNFNLFIGGSFQNQGGIFTQQGAANDGIVTFGATTGPRTIDANSATFNGPLVFNATGVTYNFVSGATIGSGRGGDSVSVLAGTVSLNRQTVTITDSLFVRSGGTFIVNQGANLQLANGADVIGFSGSSIQVVGLSDSVATVTSTAAANRYDFQVNGNIQARYYNFNNMSSTGIHLTSTATVDSANNFSDGTFSAGAAAGRYLFFQGEAQGYAATNTDTIRNATFSTGPAVNVERTAGTDTLIFYDALGVLSGPNFETDSPDGFANTGFIRWQRDAARWTAGAGTNDWFTATNWNNATLPGANETVEIDTSNVTNPANKYISPDISTAGAACGNLVIVNDSLRISGTGTLDVNGSVTVSGNAVFHVANNATINVAGGFGVNSTATFTKGTSTIIFDAQTGSHTIDMGGDSAHSVTWRSGSGTWTLQAALSLSGNFTLDSGTVDVSSSNYAVGFSGDWHNNGTFVYQAGTVSFRSTGNQSLTGNNNTFFNVNLDSLSSGSRTITWNNNVDINNTITFGGSNVILDARSNDINVGEDWLMALNKSGTIQFRSFGTGTVTFDKNDAGTGGDNSTVSQQIQSTDSLNNVTFGGSERKELVQNGAGTAASFDNGGVFHIKGQFNVAVTGGSGTDIVDINSSRITGNGPSNTLTVQPNSVLRLIASAFPDSFETVDLDASSQVRYDGRGGGLVDTIETNNGTIQYSTLILQTANTRFVTNGDLFARTLTVNNNVTLDLDNGLRNNAPGNNNLEIFVDLNQGGTGTTFNTDSSTVTFSRNDGAAVTIPDRLDTVGNLIITGNGDKDIADSLWVMGNVTLGGGATLDLNTFNIIGVGGSNSMTAGANSVFEVAGPFFSTFENVSIDPTNTTTYDGATAQQVSAFSYGNLTFDNGGGTPDVAQGPITVRGNFNVTGDGGFVAGAFTHNLQGNFALAANGSVFTTTNSTFIFSGGDQTIDRTAGGNAIVFDSVRFSGSGTKILDTGNDLTVNGYLTIDSAIIFDKNNRNIIIGANFTSPFGVITNTGGTWTFNGASQTLSPGSNSFTNIAFSGSGTKTIVTNGLNVLGTFTAAAGVTANFGALTHTFAGTWTNGGNPFVSTGTLVFNAGTYTITPVNADTFNNIQISGSGTRTMGGAGVPWVVRNNLTIDNGATLTNATNNNNLFLLGDFLNSGTYTSGTGIVIFNASSGPRTIQTNGSAFDEVRVNGTGVVYNLTSTTNTINGDLRIFTGTLDLNGRTLNFGNAAGDSIVVGSGGTLDVDDNAFLQMDNATVLNAESGATVRVVGTSGNVANMTVQNTGTDRYTMYVQSGATVHARFYRFEYMDSISVLDGATTDATNNFSDGAFSNGSATGVYLFLRDDFAGTDTIRNVTFNSGAGFNVSRVGATTGEVVFSNYSGLLGGPTYEKDPLGLITWVGAATKIWTGTVNTNWNVAGNWSPSGVPTIDNDVFIRPAANNPIIGVSAADASARTLTVGAGTVLTIGNTFAQDLNLGTGGLIDSGTVVIAGVDTINCQGDWIVRGTFSPGNSGVVRMTGTTGTQTIIMPSQQFRNLIIAGTSTVQLGDTLVMNGDFIVNSGSTFDVNGFNMRSRGNWTVDGTFIPRTRQVYFFNGSGNVTINGGTFANLAFIDSVTFAGTRTITDSIVIDNRFLVFAGTVVGNAPVDVNGTGIATSAATAAWVVSSGATFDAGSARHTVAGGIFNQGTFTGTGIVAFDGGTVTNINNATTLANVEIAGTGTKTLGGNLTLNNLDITSGTFSTSNNGYTVTAGGSSDTLTMAAGTTYDNRSSFSGFESYFLDVTSTVDYSRNDQGIVQTIIGLPPGQSYGNLALNGAGTRKTASGDLIVAGNLLSGQGGGGAGVIFDMNNFNVNIGGNLTFAQSDSFVAGNGEVTMDGSGAQTITLNVVSSSDSSNIFYKLNINKPVNTTCNFAGSPFIRVSNNLTITSGILNIGNNQLFISGSFVNQDSMQVGGTSIVHLIPASGGSVQVNGGGSLLDELRVNSVGTTFSMQGSLIVRDNFLLQAGTWDLNGQILELGEDGGGTEAHSIDGTLIVGPGSSLRLSSNSTLTASGSSDVRVVGTSGNIATVTRRAASGYGFNILGAVQARNYLFEHMGTNGIVVNSSAVVDSANNFSDGTFTNGTSGGTLFRIETSDDDTLRNVAFTANPGGGAYNVAKTLTTTGKLVFKDFTGVFGGEAFDNDPTGDTLIVWLTPDTLYWDGSSGTDWFTAANWTPNTGAERVPDSLSVVVIRNTVNKPSIDSLRGRAKELIIESSARVTLNGGSLRTEGKIDFYGILQVNQSTDSIVCGGTWTKNTGGTFTHGNGTVIFAGLTGSSIPITNNSNFYNVRMSGSSTYQLQTTFTVLNDLIINAGTLASNNNTITVGNTYYNPNGFTAGTGTFILNASSGTKSITTGGTGVPFNNLTISGAATFQLQSNIAANGNVNINAGTLQLNGRTFNMGNGADALTVASGATLDINTNAFLRMANGASVTVNSGGTIRIVGTNESSVATVTRQSSGTYAVTVNGTIHAQYYLIEYLNTSGLSLGSTAIINSTNNLSNGTFSNGAPSGTYLTIASGTTIPAVPNDTVSNVVFNSPTSGSITNVNHTAGDTIIFKDASGPYAGSLFENDSPDGGDATGQIHWAFSFTQITWTGSADSLWGNPSNWSLPTVPDATFDVIITTPVSRMPVIDTTANCRDLTIRTGTTVFMRNGDTLRAGGSININSGGTLDVATGSASHIFVGNLWTNQGTFNPGTASTVVLTANSGTKTITDGTSSFVNLRIDSNATFNLSSALDVNGDLILNAGTLDATASNYRINIGGDWKNFGGTFNAQSDSVVFDDTGADSVYAGASSFYRLLISKTSGGSVAVGVNDVTVNDFVNITSGTLFGGSNNITLSGNWTVGLGATFTAQTGTVTMSGSGIHNVITRGQAFENFVVNKTGGGQVTVNDSINVNGILNITAGTLYFNNRAVRVGNGTGTDTLRVAGTAQLDAGSTLRMHQTARGTVISGGTLQVVGSSAASRATITSSTLTPGWTLDVAGTIHSRFAFIRYSGSNGIQILSSGTVNSFNDFSYTDFSDGTGIAYLTIANGQNLSPDSTRFDSAAATRAVYNVNYTGTGTASFVNYRGTMSGVNFENDNGAPTYGNVRWSFNESPTISAGSNTFGNDFVINGAGNLGVTNGVLVSDTLPEAILAVARWYEVRPTTAGTGTGSIRLYYGQNEIQAASESNMRIWRRRNGLWTRLDSITGSTTTRDTVNNWVQFSPYTYAAGTRDTLVLSDALFEASLPVNLVYFRGSAVDGKVRLEWRTESEFDNAFWLIQRREVSAAEMERIEQGESFLKDASAQFATVMQLKGQGTKSSATDYVHFDEAIEPGKHYAYRLADVSLSGDIYYGEEILIAAELPKQFALRQNYPNPFNPSTTIRFEVPTRAKISIKIYNILGQEVFELADRVYEPGFHHIQWNGVNRQNRAVASGVYIYRVVAQAIEGKERFVKTRKMMLLK